MKEANFYNPDRLATGSAVARQDSRCQIELLRSRAELLSGRDRALMKMYLDNGASFRQMAAVAGVNEVTIARRIHQLVKRLLDGEYILCLRHQNRLGSFALAVAQDYFLAGLSQRRIAEKRNSSVYRVRKALKEIENLIQVPEKMTKS